MYKDFYVKTKIFFMHHQIGYRPTMHTCQQPSKGNKS